MLAYLSDCKTILSIALQDLWLSANGQSLLPETLEVAYDSTVGPVAHQDVDLNPLYSHGVLIPQLEKENQMSYSSAVTSCLSVSESRETVQCETDCLKRSGNGLDVTQQVNLDDRRSTTDHGLLFEKLCHQIDSTDDAAYAALLSERLHCVLEFFSAECLSNCTTVFPFHILKKYTAVISEGSDLKENNCCDNNT